MPPSTHMRFYVLLTFEHTVPSAWNKCPKPSSPLGAPPLILNHPDYVSFSCMPSFNKYVLACPARDAYGNWKQTQPLLLSWNLWSLCCEATPASKFLSLHACVRVCVCVSMHRYDCTRSHTTHEQTHIPFTPQTALDSEAFLVNFALP